MSDVLLSHSQKKVGFYSVGRLGGIQRNNYIPIYQFQGFYNIEREPRLPLQFGNLRGVY